MQEERLFRRWRPAVIMGSGVDEFAHRFFRTPPSTPWMGLVFVNNARIAGSGMAFAHNKALVGRALMSHPTLFPHSDTELAFPRPYRAASIMT